MRRIRFWSQRHDPLPARLRDRVGRNDYGVSKTGEGEQFDVCIDADTGERAERVIDTPCPAGSALIPAYLLSFKVR